MIKSIGLRHLLKYQIMAPFLLLLFITGCVLSVIKSDPTRCILNINDGKTYKEVKPLWLLPNVKQDQPFYYPVLVNGTSRLTFPRDTEILLACPGDKNYLKGANWVKETQKWGQCNGNDNFIDRSNNSKKFSVIQCTKALMNTAVKDRKFVCNDNYTLIHIGFNIIDDNNTFLIKQFEICQGTNSLTMYARHQIMKNINASQKKYQTKQDFKGNYFHGYAKGYYDVKNQKKTFTQLIGTNGPKYFNKNSLTRGHLAAKMDFVYAAQQLATFYYINVAPQWESFNGGNWKLVEDAVRNVAINNHIDITVYTGTHGTLELPDVNNNPVEMYLSNGHTGNSTIPIPKYFWKVIYDPVSELGTAIIGINNPPATNVTNATNEMFCTNVENSIPWITGIKTHDDPNYGVIFACTVTDFIKTVKVLPPLDVTGLLI